MKKQIATLALIAIAIIGCDTTKKTTETMNKNNTESITTMEQSTWQLTELDGKAVDQSNIDKKIQFSLNEIDKTVSGYTGCNSFNGNYNAEAGNRISFTPLAATKRYCGDATVNEQALLDVFNKTDNFTIVDGKLSLNVGRRAPLAVFKKLTSENKIVEKYWKLKTLEGKDVTMMPNQEREIFFTLKSQDNRVTGFAGCNSISGEYTLEDGNRIRFKNIATTMKLCSDVDINESELLNVFNTADNYTINGDVLNLNVGRRAPLAVFEAVYMQ